MDWIGVLIIAVGVVTAGVLLGVPALTVIGAALALVAFVLLAAGR